MDFCTELRRILPHRPHRMGFTVFGCWYALLTVLVLSLITIDTANGARDMQFVGQHTAIRRMDCAVFCRKTGFSGYVGGCQCGFTLFSNKRSPSSHPRFVQTASSHKTVYFPEQLNSQTNDQESIENLEMKPVSSGKIIFANR